MPPLQCFPTFSKQPDKHQFTGQRSKVDMHIVNYQLSILARNVADDLSCQDQAGGAGDEGDTAGNLALADSFRFFPAPLGG